MFELFGLSNEEKGAIKRSIDILKNNNIDSASLWHLKKRELKEIGIPISDRQIIRSGFHYLMTFKETLKFFIYFLLFNNALRFIGLCLPLNEFTTGGKIAMSYIHNIPIRFNPSTLNEIDTLCFMHGCALAVFVSLLFSLCIFFMFLFLGQIISIKFEKNTYMDLFGTIGSGALFLFLFTIANTIYFTNPISQITTLYNIIITNLLGFKIGGLLLITVSCLDLFLLLILPWVLYCGLVLYFRIYDIRNCYL